MTNISHHTGLVAKSLSFIIAGLIIIGSSTTVAYPVRRWTYKETSGDSNYDFGFSLGESFSKEIVLRIGHDVDMQRLISEFGEAARNPLYYYFVATHEEHFPEYMDELRGISDGSGVPFDQMFISQLKQEFTYYLNETEEVNKLLQKDDHCSDVIWCCQTGDIYIAHNEDASIYDVNSTVLVEAINGVNGGPGFTALVYLGQTPSNAFGFNTKGVVFTMNKLSPKYPYTEGVGRVFVGRSLLDSNGFEDAINIATQKWKLIAGHNYQIGLANSDMAVSIEVASNGNYVISNGFEPGGRAFFHANMYTILNITQILPNPSSEHRIKSFNEIENATPVQNPTYILNLLGDQADQDYPIYHDFKSHSNGDLSGYTLTSVLVNLRTCEMIVYEENPKNSLPSFLLNLC